MSITDLGQIDNVEIKNDGKCYLTIADQIDWEDALGHLELLEKKLMDYVLYSKSGKLVENYPDAKGKEVVITIVARYEIPIEVYKKASLQIGSALKENNIGLLWSQLKG